MTRQQNTVTATEATDATGETPIPVTAAGECCGTLTIAAPAAQDRCVAECPVMAGTPINKTQTEGAGLYRDYNGQRYWFCCAACGPLWDAAPDGYAAT